MLSILTVEEVIENDCRKVYVEGKLGDLAKAVSKSQRNRFPVFNDELDLVGVIKLNELRDMIFNTELYEKVLEISDD